MRVTFVIPAVTSGGAERVMAVMANYWAAKGWEMTLITFDNGAKPPFYPLDRRIHQIPIDILGDSPHPLAAITSNFRRIKVLRSAIVNSQPDVVVSFMDTNNVLTLLATRKLNIPVVVNEQIHPAMFPIGRAWEILRRWTYPRANQVVAVTERALQYFSPAVQAKGCTIPNPALSVDLNQAPTAPAMAKPSLIAVGRLHPQKGYDVLLEAFSRLQANYPDWHLTILGEGQLREELVALCDRLNLGDRVHFMGAVSDPQNFLNQADIYVMSSRFEGFPNALCEAMACGLPVISTDCLSGPREIIRNGIDGLLIPSEDPTALATAMAQLMSHPEQRQQFAERATDVTERFSLAKVMDLWEAAIARAMGTATPIAGGY
jgi:GalNAc-alpha-(1->4)-GalNAc-alpha-(1->3)-diNAcBac-PP-undecaprenol alpha-1,4-N-acetyl-D-galactosaminyltransferase